MSEKRGRGQPKSEPTRDLRNQVKLMKALGIPEDRVCKTITNPRTEKPVAPVPVVLGRLSLENFITLGQLTQGCFLRVHMCLVGRSQDVSSSAPPRTRTTPSLGRPQTQDRTPSKPVWC